LSEDARHEWESIYRDLVKESREEPKAVAGIMARVPTMVMKWALIEARILEGMAKAPDKWWRPKDIHQKVGGRKVL
jgi:hypothetical protein